MLNEEQVDTITLVSIVKVYDVIRFSISSEFFSWNGILISKHERIIDETNDPAGLNSKFFSFEAKGKVILERTVNRSIMRWFIENSNQV